MIILVGMGVLMTSVMGIADDRLDECERLLWRAGEQSKADRAEIESLYEEISRLVVEVETLKVEKAQLERLYIKKLNRQKGFYIGGNFGYPFINIDAMIMYKFDRFGLYLIGGYNQQPDIGAGFLIKIP